MTIGIVGKYVDLPDAYLSVVEALRHGAAGQRKRRRHALDPGRRRRRDAGRVVSRRCRRHPRSRRLRNPRRRGEDPNDPLCPGRGHPLPRPVSRAAVCRDRVRPQRPRSGRCQQLGVRSDDAESGHRPAWLDQEDVEDKGGTMRLGVYPAKLTEGSLGQASLRRAAHLRAPSAPLGGQQSVPQGTRGSRTAACPGCRRTIDSSRSSRSRAIPSSSPRSSIRSSSPVPTIPIRCSAASSLRPCVTAAKRVRCSRSPTSLSRNATFR